MPQKYAALKKLWIENEGNNIFKMFKICNKFMHYIKVTPVFALFVPVQVHKSQVGKISKYVTV